MEEVKRLGVELKQTAKGSWYIGSLKVNADTVEEINSFLDATMPVLRSKIEVMNNGKFESAFSPPVSVPVMLNDEEKILFEKLRSMRMDLAKAEKVPPYVIFHDSVLRKFAQIKPITKEEMMKVEGVGERSFDKYGVYFLKVIRSSCQYAENGG